MNSFSTLYPDSAFSELEHVGFENLLGQNIIIEDICPLSGRHGEYIAIKFKTEENGVSKKTTTYSKVVVEQLLKVHKDGNLPITAKVSQVEDYYKLV